MKVEFPPNGSGVRYYHNHILFFRNMFELVGINTTISTDLKVIAPAIFYVKINDKLVLIDYSDGENEYALKYTKNTGTIYTNQRKFEPENLNVPIFKAQLKPTNTYKNIFALPPLTVVRDRSQRNTHFEKLFTAKNRYNPHKYNDIICTNRFHMNAAFTRQVAISKIDKTKIPSDINIIRNRIDTLNHYERYTKSLGTINISGATTNTVDAGHMESMFLGVCNISNNIDNLLPWNYQIKGGEHYIQLKDDYSDINEKINYLYENRQEAKDMGENIYKTLRESSIPTKVSSWVEKKTEEYYDNK